MVEVEIKIQVDKEMWTIVKERVQKIGGQVIIEKEEHDIYFNSPSKDFIESDEALRIRKDVEGVRLTYKGPKIDKETKTRDEVEITINSFEKGIELLERLGFTPVRPVVKNRTIFRLEDIYISLDYIEELGYFIELEKKSEEKDVSRAITELKNIITVLNLNDYPWIRESYLELLIEKDRKKRPISR
jgi:adenylate cyclase class 2